MNNNATDKNICRFVPYHADQKSIHTINFVLETKPQNKSTLKCYSVFRIYYVLSGEGEIFSGGRDLPLYEGDVFFTFPGTPHGIESGKDFRYMYISFLGSRSNMIMESLKISQNNFLFRNCHKLKDYWTEALNFEGTLSDLLSESVLLYTFAFLGSKVENTDFQKKHNSSVVSKTKKYIDDNFSDNNLSLEIISKKLMYNKKYISYMFKKNMNVGISEYLNTIRIQNACTMIERGYTSVNDIAACCGYKDAQYFSKVFKKQTGIPPLEYIRNVRK